MSKTAVDSSEDVKVMLASHVSKVPAIATDAFTLNLTVLSERLISNTGTPCARLSDGNTADAKRQSTANRVVLSISLSAIRPSRFRIPRDQVILRANSVAPTGKTASFDVWSMSEWRYFNSYSFL